MSDSLDLFDDLGQILRDAGMKKSIDHANQLYPMWESRAYSLTKRFIGYVGEIDFTAEDIREYAERLNCPHPPDRRAWGHIVKRAVKDGLITKVGYRAHRDPSRHCGISTVWRKV